MDRQWIMRLNFSVKEMIFVNRDITVFFMDRQWIIRLSFSVKEMSFVNRDIIVFL